MGRSLDRLQERFDAKYAPDPNSGCWLWTGQIINFGYGLIKNRNGRPRAAHRISYELHVGEIPAGMLVCHRCDVPACVNPEHLFLGTYTDNNRDCQKKGRTSRGEKRHMAKLTAADVVEIRRRHTEDGATNVSLSSEFGVCPQTISRVVLRDMWRHVP